MENGQTGGVYFPVYKTPYLELYKFSCPLLLSFWFPVKENVAKNYFLLFLHKDEVEMDWKMILEGSQ